MMCNCKICEFTDSFADRSFADWPKGEHINRSGKKDKAYAAHWNFCGAEAHKTYEKLNLKMHLGGRFWNKSEYAHLPHYQGPFPE